MSFFVCPYIFLIFAPKIGMNRRGIVLQALVAIHPDFRGLALAVVYKGIIKDDISMLSYAFFHL
jgi:hypothetical protein